MEAPAITVTWEESMALFGNEGANRMVVFVHGTTIYQYLNATNEEAERRFQQEMSLRNPIMAQIEPVVARAYSVKFNDEICLWLNAAEDIQKLVDAIFVPLLGDKPSGEK